MLFVRLRINIYLRDFSAISADQSAFTLGFESSVLNLAFSVRFGAAVVQFHSLRVFLRGARFYFLLTRSFVWYNTLYCL